MEVKKEKRLIIRLESLEKYFINNYLKKLAVKQFCFKNVYSKNVEIEYKNNLNTHTHTHQMQGKYFSKF